MILPTKNVPNALINAMVVTKVTLIIIMSLILVVSAKDPYV
jgi:hypothetical protein